jgi:radical SAM superfamily enzyme YgiQ (UPF0313 family)
MPLNIFALGSYIKTISDVIVWDFPMKYGVPLSMENYLRIFEEFRNDILSEEPDLVGISCTSSDEYYPTKRVARAVKEVLPSVNVIVGGYHASSCAEELLRESGEIDCIVTGEGEVALKRIVQNKIDKKPIFKDAPGILTWKNKTLYKTDSVIMDVNDLPLLDVDLIESASKYPIVAAELSRGCPFKCNFCQESSIKGNLWRAKSPKRAIKEIEYLRERIGHETFYFNDPLFGANEKWAIDFCEGICEKNIDIDWFAMVRLSFKKVTLDMMGKAGAYSLFYGLESGSQDMLRLIDKVPGSRDYTSFLNNAESVLVNTVEAGILPIVGIIVGYPGENKKTMQETLDYIGGVAKKCKKLSGAGFWVDPMYYFPLPKTRAVELLDFYEKKFGTVITDINWWKRDFPFANYFRTLVVRPSKEVSSEDLEKYKRRLKAMSYITDKGYTASFWNSCQAPEMQRLRQNMMKGDIFDAKTFLELALQNWESVKRQGSAQSLPTPRKILRLCKRKLSRVRRRVIKSR